MAKKLIKTEQEVLDKIGASDFRSISKNQIISFVSSIPEMDKEVAIHCIEQFPNFAEYSNDIVSGLYSLLDEVKTDHRKSRENAVETYQHIVDKLLELASRPDLSIKEQQEFIDKSIDVANKIAELHRDNSLFLQKIIQTAATVGGGALAIAGAVLGVKIIGKK